MATIADLVPLVESRVDEVVESPPIFWVMDEFTSALMEAQCDLMLLVGRPDLTVSVPFNIVPNTPWQTVPEGVFAITNLQGPASEVWKVTLEDMDYAQVAGPDWEQDIGDTIQKWFPLGLGKFGVWPSVAQEQTVLLTGIASPVTSQWPYDGTQAVPFPDYMFQALEKYAAHYLIFKEATDDFGESQKVYQSYLDDAKTLTGLQDRIDPYLFSGSVGAQVVANPTKQR